MRKERLYIGNIFEDAEHRDDIGLLGGFAREFTPIEVTDDGVRLAADEITASVARGKRQKAAKRHLSAAEIEDPRSGWNELGGEFGAAVPSCFQRIRI